MKCYVRWIFVVLVMCSLTSFIAIGGYNRGLNVGDAAPDFRIKAAMGSEQPADIKLSSLRGRYVLLSFWASYDAPSRMQNKSLNNKINSESLNVELVSVSFDDYQSIFTETVRKDGIIASACFREDREQDSKLFDLYNLNRGFENYLIDEKGVIVAKNITPNELLTYM